MSFNVTFNGAVYIIPETGEVGWGGNVSSYLIALAAGSLQKTGGSFTLSAETDFGAAFGLMSLYYKSRSANIATTGILRLNNNSDSISWRNASNTADLPLIVNAADQLFFNGNYVLTGTGSSSYVSSITGTANQVIASGSIGAVTLSLPQSIGTTSAVRFGSLALGGVLATSAILSIASTSLGFLPPRMTTVQRDAIVTPATGLFIYNTDTNQYNSYNGTSWVALAASSGGTINAGLQFQLGYYAANGTTISPLPLITASRALASDTNGLPVASVTTAAELAFISGLTSAVQTQLNTKATDSLVAHLAGTETFTGQKTFGLPIRAPLGSAALPSFTFAVDTSTGMYSPGAGSIGFSALGTLILTVQSNAIIGGNVPLLLGQDGTAALPALSWNADQNTGLYRPGADNIAFATAGLQRFRIDGNGDLIISSVGHVYNGDGSLAVPAYSFDADVDTGFYRIGSNNVGLSSGGIKVIDASSSGVAILGTTTNNSAVAGDIGEVISAAIGPTNVPASANFGDLTSISLTAGAWLVSIVAVAYVSTTTTTYFSIGISTTAGNSATGLIDGDTRVYAGSSVAFSPVALPSLSIPSVHMLLAGTTTVYLKYNAIYSSGTPQMMGRITAVRIR